eukprot:TRINITY_DN504_c0_g1_i2.p2 TRINITY_DN504_c0_g1~~TRINITY_DN504_c0_g1_i2.p2  ORF type:complete len:395 (-),score=47.56 TRINITY_DN504_c0_g1_i2:75-1205(-)
MAHILALTLCLQIIFTISTGQYAITTTGEGTSTGIGSATGLHYAIYTSDLSYTTQMASSAVQMAVAGDAQSLAASLGEAAVQGQAAAVADAIVSAASQDIQVLADAIVVALSDPDIGLAVVQSFGDVSTIGTENAIEAIIQGIIESIGVADPYVLGTVLVNFCFVGEASIIADIIYNAVKIDFDAASDVFANVITLSTDSDSVSCIAQACQEACNSGISAAESMGEAVTRASSMGYPIVAAESFVAGSASKNADHFISQVASSAVEINCESVAKTIAEAARLGSTQAVSNVVRQAECLKTTELIQAKAVECPRYVRRCIGSASRCCVPEIIQIQPGDSCNTLNRQHIYSGVCEDDISKIVLEPLRVGFPCYCQIED